MIDKAGNARIMDFGIARSAKGEALTGENVIIGTPDYMSPEQVEGKDIDQRSDIYSLGVVLFEMLTGERPFKGDTSLSVAMKQKSEAPPNPKWLNDQIPDSLSRLVLLCLEKDKERRYQSAEELLSALSNIDDKKLYLVDKEEKKKSIAVLPFEDMSSEKDQEYFCDGMAEEIINSLTHIKDLKVIARTSAFAFKGRHEDIREIGRKLDVETLMEGSVRKSGNKLRIMAQLINVADGSHLWSERYDRNMEDIFEIQDEISLAIVDKLKIKLFKREKEALAKRYTEDVETYSLYLKGMHFFQTFTAKGFDEAIECFQQALKKDPSFAQAYIGLVSVQMARTYHGNIMPPHKVLPKAKELLKKALEIDNTLAVAHAWMGWHKVYEWNWEEAENNFKKALELNPNDAWSHAIYANFLTVTEQSDKAISEAKYAQELDPLSGPINSWVGMCFQHAGQLDIAIGELRQALKIDPDFYQLHLYLGNCLFEKSIYEEAIKELELAVELSGRAPWPITVLALMYFEIGRTVEAEKLFESLKSRLKDEYIPPISFFLNHLIRGEKDKALEWLERACREHDSLLPYMRVYPADIFRIPDEPEYQDLLNKYGVI
jgi:TolB-like protein/Tfp pilus assembly protein PilF